MEIVPNSKALSLSPAAGHWQSVAGSGSLSLSEFVASATVKFVDVSATNVELTIATHGRTAPGPT